ncbi:MAG: hypothetical protein AB7I27_05685 [Bacteriovoracaceae bacterium]
MKKSIKSLVLLTLILGAGFSYYFFQHQNKESVKELLVNHPQIKKYIVKTENYSEKNAGSKNLEELGIQETTYKYRNHHDYFKKVILQNPMAKELYHNSLQVLGDHREAALVAEFIAEGVAREDTPIFGQYMKDLLSDLNAGNKDVAELVINKEKLLQKSKFQYQMVLNMAYAMKLPTDAKTRILGGALLQPFIYDKNGSITPESTNISNGMILMKNSQLPKDKVFAFLQLGMKVNKNHPAALKEFQYRANAYFPEMIDKAKP